MQKTKKLSIFLSLITVLSSTAAIGCDRKSEADDCTHAYVWYIVEEPTCSREGKLEGICGLCGEKTYQALALLSHEYENGICTVCGAAENGDIISNDTIGWSLSSLYNRSRSLGFLMEQEEFLSECNELALSSLSMSPSGVLSAKLQKNGTEYSAALKGLRQNFTVEKGETGFIKMLEITSSRLYVTTADGLRTNYGIVQELYSSDSPRLISRIAINAQNAVVVIYNDDTAVRVGYLPSVAVDTDEGALIYTPAYDYSCYYVYGAMDKTAETITIPATHRGLLVTGIEADAFTDCAALKNVIVPASVTSLYSDSFPEGVTIFYAGQSLNDTALQGKGITIYLADEWEMLDGIPSPII